MIAQLTGTATVLVLVLAYLLIVQAMTAAVVLLSQFIVVQVKALRSMLPVKSQPVRQTEPAPTYRIGGGLMRW